MQPFSLCIQSFCLCYLRFFHSCFVHFTWNFSYIKFSWNFIVISSHIPFGPWPYTFVIKYLSNCDMVYQALFILTIPMLHCNTLSLTIGTPTVRLLTFLLSLHVLWKYDVTFISHVLISPITFITLFLSLYLCMCYMCIASLSFYISDVHTHCFPQIINISSSHICTTIKFVIITYPLHIEICRKVICLYSFIQLAGTHTLHTP
jgi:hypothetical protein